MAGHRARKIAVTIGALGALGALRAIGAAQAPQPTFRSEINFVQIPVRVLDAHGEFVRGLTQSDFRILEDGQPQTITSFSAIDIPFVRHEAVTPGLPLAAGEPVASNDPLQVDGRVYVFVLDNQSMPAAVALRTRHVMRRFIAEGIAANDMAAIVLTGTGRGQAFTRNRSLLNAAIDRLMSDADPTDNSADRVFRVIADTTEWMGAIKGRRKALVLVTPSALCSLANVNSSVFSNCNEEVRHALRAAMQSEVSIYTIDPKGIVPTNGAPAEVDNPGFARYPVIVRGPLDAARYLAEESGGFAVVNTNNLMDGFRRMVGDNSSYYLVGYYSTNPHADGKARRNEITVSRAHLRVVHRASYIAPSEKGRREGQ
jgi:VWFA-related protein